MKNETQDADATIVSKAAGKARNLVKATQEQAEAVAGGARDNAYRAADKANSLLTEHPLAAAAAVAAAGAVIGMMLPRWRIGSKVGMAVGTTARNAAKALAMAETAKSLMSGLASAGGAVRTRAQHLAEQAPDVKTVKAGATRALALASEAAQMAGREVAQQARRVAKSVETADKAMPTRKTRSKRKTGED